MIPEFFISHSKETKQDIAIPLVQSLSSLGFNIWFDRKEISSGQHIYQELKKAIFDAVYCVAIIDSTFLTRAWTLEELDLFHSRENTEKRTLVLPIYVNIDKESVYEKVPWLEGRAFDKLSTLTFDTYKDFEIICRIVGRYSKDNTLDTFEKSYQELINYAFPCKNTLFSLINNKEYLSSNLQIAIIEICNIGGVVNAIYNAIATQYNKNIDISFNFSNTLRNICFDANYNLTYSMYISAIQAITVAIEQLKILLDSI